LWEAKWACRKWVFSEKLLMPNGATLRSILVGVAIAMTATALTAIPAFDNLHGKDTDVLHWLRANLPEILRPPPSSHVVVVAIDEATYRAAPFKGLPRAMWTPQIATVQDAVLDAGATVFGWDLILPTSANTYVADKRYDKPLLVSLSRRARTEGKVVLGEIDLGDQPLSPFPFFTRAAGGPRNVSSLNAYVDGDGIVRGVPLYLTYETETGPTLRAALAMEVARRHLGIESAQPLEGDVVFAGYRVPTVGQRNMILSFDDRVGAIPTYSLADIHDCAVAGNERWLRETFEGKAVLLGMVLDLEDRKLAGDRLIRQADYAGAPEGCMGSTPTAAPITRQSVPGVYLHATGVNNLIDGAAVARPGPGSRLVAALALAVLGVVAAFRFRPVRGLAVALSMGAIYTLVASLFFLAPMELPLGDPLAAMGVALAGGIGYRFVAADKEQARVRKTFAHYLDPKVIDAMLDRGDVPQLGGENRQLTCFFSDIAAFSSISESMSPTELVRFLNEYFSVIGHEIEAHGGIIERFLGDAVCAVFGAPVRDENNAVSAVRAALAIERGLKAAQHRFGLPEGRVVETRIGINSGEMTVGNVGADRRFTYTVMGDAVNLAARLESVNKQYGTLLLAGDATVAATGDTFIWREIDRVRVVGRDTPVTLYQPLDEASDTTPRMLDIKNRYEDALRAFRAMDLDAAEKGFRDLADAGDRPALKMLERVTRSRVDPPPPDWDGVTDLMSK
jgi:adenylate cyclase